MSRIVQLYLAARRVSLTTVLILSSPAIAEKIDSFDRPDSDALGTTEVGKFKYVETLTTGELDAGDKPVNVARIEKNRLLITGHGGKNQSGRVFVQGYDARDVTVSVKAEFRNAKSPESLDRPKNPLGIMVRTRQEAHFGHGDEFDTGYVTVEFLNNGSALIRERKASGKLASVAPGTKYEYAPGSLGTTFNGLPYDRNDNGVLEEGESFILTVAVAGKSLTVSVNGKAIFTGENALENAGSGSGIALFKGRPGSTFEVSSDLLIDDLTVTPLPESKK